MTYTKVSKPRDRVENEYMALVFDIGSATRAPYKYKDVVIQV